MAAIPKYLKGKNAYNYNMITKMFIRNRKYTNLQNSIPKHNLAVSIQCIINMFIVILNTKMKINIKIKIKSR